MAKFPPKCHFLDSLPSLSLQLSRPGLGHQGLGEASLGTSSFYQETEVHRLSFGAPDGMERREFRAPSLAGKTGFLVGVEFGVQ